MNITVINGAPAGNDSITLQTVLYLQILYPKENWTIISAGQKIKYYETHFEEVKDTIEQSDLILFSYPVYTFLVPSQLHRFIELMKENEVKVSGKPACQITTSKHFYDVTAHRFIKDNCDDMGMKYLGGLSADMEDLLKEKGQKDARQFFELVMWRKAHDIALPVSVNHSSAPFSYQASLEENEKTVAKTIAIVTDLSSELHTPLEIAN